MKALLLALFTICSFLCNAQEYTVSVERTTLGKVAVLDQDFKLNSEATLNFSYLPMVGDVKMPTLIIVSNKFHDIFMGKDYGGIYNSISVTFETTEGMLTYYASPEKKTVTEEYTDGETFTSILTFLPMVDLKAKGKFLSAKRNTGWANKVKKILTNSVVHKIKFSASVTCGPLDSPKKVGTKTVEYTIDVSPDADMASIFKMLFTEGDK